MFQTISFTFLCALAVVSWLMLCYLDAIDEKKEFVPDYKVELYTEHSKGGQKYCQDKPTENNFMSRTYNMLLNYGIVILTTLLLSTVLQWLESRVCSYMKVKRWTLTFQESFPYIKVIPNEPEIAQKLEEKPPIFVNENVELKEQLNDLQTRVQELLKELNAVNSNSIATDPTCIPSNSSFSGSEGEGFQSNDETSDKSSGLSIAQNNELQSSTSLAQNVYITHSHYHINFNGAVHILNQSINFGTLRPKNMRRSEFLQVSGRFIKGPMERPMLTSINNILI